MLYPTTSIMVAHGAGSGSTVPGCPAFEGANADMLRLYLPASLPLPVPPSATDKENSQHGAGASAPAGHYYGWRGEDSVFIAGSLDTTDTAVSACACMRHFSTAGHSSRRYSLRPAQSLVPSWSDSTWGRCWQGIRRFPLFGGDGSTRPLSCSSSRLPSHASRWPTW